MYRTQNNLILVYGVKLLKHIFNTLKKNTHIVQIYMIVNHFFGFIYWIWNFKWIFKQFRIFS